MQKATAEATNPMAINNHVRKSMKGSFSPEVLSFIKIMSLHCPNLPWSFIGGFARDMYLGYQWNDFDVGSIAFPEILSELHNASYFNISEDTDNRFQQHDIFIEPYSGEEYPVHFIETNEHALAPQKFDFTINHICLFPNGVFSAPKLTWSDLDKGIIRLSPDVTPTVNIMLRAIRFSAKYQFKLDSEFLEVIRLRMEEGQVDTLIYLNNIQKMIDENLAQESFKMLSQLGFPYVDTCLDLHGLSGYLKGMIDTNQAIVNESRLDRY